MRLIGPNPLVHRADSHTMLALNRAAAFLRFQIVLNRTQSGKQTQR